jgi:Mg-chelatase subunit ChlD
MGGVSEPELAPPGDAWMPRQELLAIETVAVGAELLGLERRVIPDIERVPAAPDIVLPGSPEMAKIAGTGAFPVPVPSASRSMREAIGEPSPAAVTEQAPVVARGERDRERFEETPDQITDIEPVERVLTARVETFADRRDRDYAYFRLVIERAGSEALPVRPKDVLLVQDASASMAEQRLYFCREAMRRALALIGPADRFNVASFSDRTKFCFPNWVTKTPETLAQAEAFINAMVSEGNTDLFASMQDLLTLERQPGRPVVAFVLTDGLVNKGLTDSTEIIGAFTRQNQGKLSIFTMGVSAQANRYLIDLLSYCNGGSTEVIESGRWDIPVAAERVMQGLQRPVLSDLTLRFGADSTMEVYPQRLGNLYLDRPLVLFGRYRRAESKLVFQAIGQAGATRSDMIFDLPLNTVAEGITSGDAAIRETWAQQKIYHLLGEYARRQDREILRDLRQTGRDYGVTIPYRRLLGL